MAVSRLCAVKTLSLRVILSAGVAFAPFYALTAYGQTPQALPTMELNVDALDKMNMGNQQAPAPQPTAMMPAQPEAAPKLIWQVGPPGRIVETPPPVKKEKPVHKKHPKKKKPVAAPKEKAPKAAAPEPITPVPEKAPAPKAEATPAPAPVPPKAQPAAPVVPAPKPTETLPAITPPAAVTAPALPKPPAPVAITTPIISAPPAPTPAAPLPPVPAAPTLPPPPALPQPPKAAATTPAIPVPPVPDTKPVPIPQPPAPVALPPLPADTKPAIAAPAAPTPSPAPTPAPTLPAAPPPPPAPPLSEKAPAADLSTQKTDDSAAVQATTKALSEPKTSVAVQPAQAVPAKPAAAQGTPALTIAFKSTETTVPLSMQSQLDDVVKQLVHNPNQRVTLVAYASVVGDQVSTARRVSLSRALSVRAYLIDANVSNLRINVQAEGDKNPGGDPDRVDLFVQTSDDKGHGS